MLTTRDVENVIQTRGRGREHLMLVLRDLERLSGNNTLDSSVLAMVADTMNLPKSVIAGFLSFYTMFSNDTRARYVIRVCTSGPCHVMGSRSIVDVLQQYLGIKAGQATDDGVFFLEKTPCLGICSIAPAMMVNYDLHGALTEARIKEILGAYRSTEPLAEEHCGPEVAGRVCVIDEAGQAKRLLEKVGMVEPLSIESYMENGGYSGLKKAIAVSPGEVVELVKASGLRGRGGAGFPAGVKWSFMPKDPGIQKFVICNADEGEPGTFKDRIIMEENPHLVIEGMTICGYATGSTHGYIYVRGEFRRSIDRLRHAIDQARKAGILGNNILFSGFSFDIDIKEGGGSYVCGEESALINSMEGKRGYPRFRPPFPAGAGFKQLPSNVNNVETYASAPMILHNGPDWFRSVGTSGCPGTKLFGLSGNLERTGLVELPMGTTLRTIIDTYGKGVKDGKKFKFAQVGGSAGGILGEDLLDLPLDIDSATKAGVTLGSGAVLVCDEDVCPVDFLLNVLAFFEHESCGQCVPCRVGTAQLHHLAKKFARRQAKQEDIDTMIRKARLMKNALCALGQSPILPITSMLKCFRKEFERHCDPGYACPQCDKTLSMI
jgi:NADH:ubiquinone oxidoreductase subunit F (NADH-binding)/NADH:ubiquinone oxidoreductase subunit E